MNKDKRGRPHKDKLDYFSHDVNMRHDEALHYLCAKYKNANPYSIFTIILEMIYGSNEGYYLNFSNKTLVLISDFMYLDIEATNNMINDMISERLFSENLYQTYKILTSEQVQKRYIRMVERRSKVNFIREYLLVNPYDVVSTSCELKQKNGIYIFSITEQPQILINGTLNTINGTLNPINGELNTQSESKSKSIYTHLGEIFENSDFEKIPFNYALYIIKQKKFNREKEAEELRARLAAADKTNPELYNALIECKEFLEKYDPGMMPNTDYATTYADLVSRLTGSIWQEQVCVSQGFDKTDFNNYTLEWLEKKRLTSSWQQYRISATAQFLINDYLNKQNKPQQNGRPKHKSGTTTKSIPSGTISETGFGEF